MKNQSKRNTRYWWDFGWDGDILKWVIIESANPKMKVVARFTWSGEFATKAIDHAVKIIDDLKSGRKNIKQVYTTKCVHIS